MMPSFLVNYGGPVKGYTAQESKYQEIFAACEKKYHGQMKSTSFSRNGLDLTYYQVGIHRMIKVELPASVEMDLHSGNSETQAQARKTQQLFRTAMSRASDFNTRDYHLLGNNCVTAVSNVLNIIDRNLLAGSMKVVPASLDSNMSQVAKKDVLMEAMLEECIRGSVEIADEAVEDDWDEFRTSAIAARVWREAMTSVDELRQQQSSGATHLGSANESQRVLDSSADAQSLQADMKTQMQTMRSADTADTQEQDKPPGP